jgi:hypothetical protein
MEVPCYVIHLGHAFQNQDALKHLNPIGFKGVDARRDEHLEHLDRVHPACQRVCAKAVIGCGLSHVLLAEKLHDEGVPLALVLEDDAYPLARDLDVDAITREVPDDWEVIRLHCDAYCDNDSNEVGLNGSTAAYLINAKGLEKMKDVKVAVHIDFQQSLFSSIKVYKTKKNLFRTDESSSGIRANGSSPHWLARWLPEPTSGEKTTDHVLSYATIGGITNGNIVDVLIILLVMWLIYRFF